MVEDIFFVGEEGSFSDSQWKGNTRTPNIKGTAFDSFVNNNSIEENKSHKGPIDHNAPFTIHSNSTLGLNPKLNIKLSDDKQMYKKTSNS